MKKFYSAVFLFCVCIRVQAFDTNTVLDKWFAAQAGVHGISADFLQTRKLKTLSQPLKTKGHLWFAPPNQFRWQLGDPAQTIALRHGDDMYVVYPKLKRAEHYPLGASAPREWRDAMSLLDAGFPHQRSDFDTQFVLQSLTQENGQWVLKLQPRSANARQVMPTLFIRLAANDYSLAGTESVFIDGSSMRNDFSNIVVNGSLDEKTFDWTPPADFKVTNPLGQ